MVRSYFIAIIKTFCLLTKFVKHCLSIEIRNTGNYVDVRRVQGVMEKQVKASERKDSEFIFVRHSYLGLHSFQPIMYYVSILGEAQIPSGPDDVAKGDCK